MNPKDKHADWLLKPTANELADKWDVQGFSEYELERECGNQMANMLRQQQAEIEALNRFIAERGETGQLIIWKAQEK